MTTSSSQLRENLGLTQFGRYMFSRAIYSVTLGTWKAPDQRSFGVCYCDELHLLWRSNEIAGAPLLSLPSGGINMGVKLRHEMHSYRQMLWIFRRCYHGDDVLVKVRLLVMSYIIHYVWLARNWNIREGVYWYR